MPRLLLHLAHNTRPLSGWLVPPSDAGIMWSASALLDLRCPLFVYWSLTPHAGQCVMPMAWARASTCFLNCLCSRVLVLLTVVLFSSLFLFVLGGGASQRQRDERLHRLTLLSSFSFSFSPRLSSFVLWNGVCCVVRAQPCEHARNTTHALLFPVCLPACAVRVTPLRTIAPTTHCSLLTITAFLFEHYVPLITLQHM